MCGRDTFQLFKTGPLPLATLLLATTVAAQERHPKVDQIFAQWDRADSPGCTVGVIHDGHLVYQRGYGMANLDYSIPNSPGMVYYIGSVSKQFTAAAIATLALDGRISLDDAVSKYIPEVRHLPPMTIRSLVHHTSGLRDIYVLMSLAGIRMQDVFPDRAAIDLITRQRQLNFAPGTEYLYSNSGYFLLGQIVKRVTGQSLREYADERIFRRLGMHNTHFHDEPYHVLKNRAVSYQQATDGSYRISYLMNFDKIGAGGLYTTVGDLLLWDRNFYDNQLGNGFLELMHTRGVLATGDTLPYAFGLEIGQYRGLRTVRHGGSLMGFKADLVRFPQQRFTAIALCNLESINPAQLTNQIADSYLRDRLAPRVAGAAPPRRDAPAERATPAYDPVDYTGTYVSDELKASYRIEQRSSGLWVIGGLPEERRLVPESRDVFRAGSYVFRFERDAAGRVRRFSVEAGRVKNIYFNKAN